MADLPKSPNIPAALIWITIRDFEACQEAFEADEALQRESFGTKDDKTTATVSVWKLGLLPVSCIIAKYLHPGDRIIRDKWGTFELLGDARVRPKGEKRDTAAVNYEYAQAERKLLRTLRDGDITAYTIGSDNVRREVDAALWLGREFEAEVGEDGHYHVVATATGKEPLRDIVFEKNDILRKWPPEGGRKRGPKIGRPTDKHVWCSMAIEILESQKVLPGSGAITKIAKLILEKGRYTHELRTITKAIGPIVNEWKEKRAKAARSGLPSQVRDCLPPASSEAAFFCGTVSAT